MNHVVSRDVVNVFLAFLEAGHVLFEGDGLVCLGRGLPQQVDQFAPVGRVVDHPLLQVVPLCFVEVSVTVVCIV